MIEDLFYRVVELINTITKKLLHFKVRKDEVRVKEKWNLLFQESDKFLHKLTDDIKIFLYKNSVLSKPIYDGFEQDEINFLIKSLQKGDIFLDIGANVGLFSLHASNLVGETGKIICYEPTPETFRRLNENIKINNFSNIIAINKGLSDKNDFLEINISENGYDAWNTFASGESNMFHKKVKIEVGKLDDELDKIEKSKIKLVKIDVEGWEKFVLQGAEYFLKNYSPIVMMEFTEQNTFYAGYQVQELYDIMVEYGFNWYRYKNNELIPEPKQLHYPYDNLIAIKD